MPDGDGGSVGGVAASTMPEVKLDKWNFRVYVCIYVCVCPNLGYLVI